MTLEIAAAAVCTAAGEEVFVVLLKGERQPDNLSLGSQTWTGVFCPGNDVSLYCVHIHTDTVVSCQGNRTFSARRTDQYSGEPARTNQFSAYGLAETNMC